MELNSTEKFKKKTGYDIDSFFRSYILFIENHYQSIIGYYNGGLLVKESFNVLEFLKQEASKIEGLIDHYGSSFTTTDFWDLNNAFSDVLKTIETCEVMGKWQRSSRLNRYSENLKISHIQKQNETIEKIASDSGFSDPDKWAEIAVENQVWEEKYTNRGGALFTISLPNNVNFELDNVVDYLVGENIYGKDVLKKIEILPDGDLATVYGRENLRQIFEIILSTTKGSIPEFKNDGMPSELFGTNENIIQYPIIFRSLLNMIQKDKRFTSFDLLDIRKEEDSIHIEIQATTITGDTLVNNIIL